MLIILIWVIKGHKENRIEVGALCGKKPVEEILVNFPWQKYENLIKNLINEDFQTSDPRFPLGICGTCRQTLFKHYVGNLKRPMLVMPNYLDLNLPIETKANNGDFDCFVCLISSLLLANLWPLSYFFKIGKKK